MRAKARFLGHSVHQMLIVFPLGLLGTAVIFDIIHLITGSQLMAAVSYWMIAAGLVGGLLAAPFGFIDWLGIPRGTRAKRVGAMHGAGNVVVLLLFAASFLLRDRGYTPGAGEMIWSFLGAGVSLVTAWLGGELVGRLAIGVDEEAGVNAPSSLRPRQREVAGH